MIGRTNSGGASDRLVLRVLGGLTTPSTPKENDIWVKIPETVFEWALVASNASVSNRSGRVWIKLGDGNTNEFNVIKTVSPANQLWCSPVSCVIGDGSSWRSVNAYLYKNSAWVQFSKEFAATINITYPAGSTCTVTDGVTTHTAPDTSGTWACIVNNTGTWTITSTNGIQTKSDSVSITADGQSASVTLKYEYYIFNAGGVTNYSGGWTALGYYTVTKVDSEGIKIYTASSWEGAQAFSNSAIDLSKYTKLNINVSAYNSARPEASFGVNKNKPNNIMWNGDFTNKNNCAAKMSITSTGVKTIDISSLSGSYYFWTGEDGATYDNAGYTINKVWLS